MFSELSPELLARIQTLHDKGQSRQAYDLATANFPLNQVRGVDACILAGRIAANLGAGRLAFRQHVRAYRSEPKNIRAQAYYLEVVLGMRGPVFAWNLFKRFESESRNRIEDGVSDEGWEYLFTLGGRICGHFRDFERAEECLKMAEERKSRMPWLLIERAGLLCMQEKWEEGLDASQQAIKIQPWYRPAVIHSAVCLHTLNRNDEALHLLNEAAQQIESVPLLHQLTGLQLDLEKYDEALQTLDRFAKLSPILDKANHEWIASQRCRAACVLGNYKEAEACARLLADDYHLELAERLQAGRPKCGRIQLSIPFIQQYSQTCVPATLTMLCRYWNIPAEHVEVAEAICYDGTPSHRARRWAEANGMVTREFTLDWDIAVHLLARQVPFAVYTSEATSGHIQIVMGYDEARQVFILRDPGFPQLREVISSQFLKRYAANGPASMVAVPTETISVLDGLSFTDAPLYDQLRSIQQALEEHRRSDAVKEISSMQSNAPDHWLFLTASRSLYSYDTNWPALLECLDQLLKKFPKDGNLSLSKLGCLRQIGRREDRLEFLRGLCEGKGADPVFQQQLAQELMVDARQFSQAELILRQAIRFQSLNASIITSLAELNWNEHQFDEALDLYRHAACLEDKKEAHAYTYFAATNARRQTETGLGFLRRRWERNGKKSAAPFITWFNALQQAGRSREAMISLEDELHSQPHHGDLWLTAADAHTRHGNFEQAEKCLMAAEKRVQRATYLRVKAELARYRTDLKAAIALWREALQIESLSIPAQRSFVQVLAETEGRESAIEYLREFCNRFPHHYQMNQLWCEWARGAGPEKGEAATLKLVQAHPADAWARRQLALVLSDAAKFDEALLEAEEGLRLAPQVAVSYATRAHVRLWLGRTTEAQEDFRQAIRLSVDYSPAIHGLVNSCNNLRERKEALAFVEQELIRQVVFGEGLHAYRDAARLSLEPELLLLSLRAAFKERPDLFAAWSVIVHQLAEMLLLDEALALAKEATEKFPLQESTWFDLTLVCRLRLDSKGERDALEQAMRISPASGHAARMLAQLNERLGEISRSKELLEEACAREPLDACNHGSLALNLWQQGNQAAAIAKLQHAVKVQPGYDWGWQTLASWATATNQPRLAEDLAKIMVLQRPGDISSMLVLARLLATTRRMEEALQLVKRSLKSYQLNTPAHVLHAEILEALGRPAEADLACEPDVFGNRPPATLRACRASLESQRGNLVSAIERMREVLKEDPGYAGGWQNLADWLWRQNQPEEALAAITNVGKLDPLNPIPLGYRASMKLQKGDRVGAKADLSHALKLDPGYSFASLELFNIQLAEPDLNGAWKTLELIRRYVGGEKAKACEIQLRTKSSQVLATQTPTDKNQAKLKRGQELDLALAHLRELCLAKDAQAGNVEVAIRALLDANESKRVEKILAEAIKNPDCNAAVGSWWMKRRIAHGNWFATRQVNRICAQSSAARNAIITLIEKLGDYDHTVERTIAILYLLLVIIKLVGRELRCFALRWLSWRHRKWLRLDNHAWASMGYAFTKLQSFRATIRWMRDWRQRSDLQMWMLLNLALAHYERREWLQLREVLTNALKLPEKDHTFQKLRLMLAMELAMSRDTEEAARHLREIKPSGLSTFMQLHHHFTQSLIAVQQARSSEKTKVFHSERKRLKNTFARMRASTNRADFRRCAIQMAKDTGNKWMIVSTWLGF
ncbi:MAG TPA: tetratricopeptide repeat protein [Verrucomicrobiae bacterium]|nr:tetratricopeptide repeat protein [Verrucomicrobiae bacterium]